MKKYIWIFTLIGVATAGLFGWRWLQKRTVIKNPANNQTAKEDLRAMQYAANRDIQAAQTVTMPGVLTPKASWVRTNGAIIDLNQLGGVIPPLVTVPSFNAWN